MSGIQDSPTPNFALVGVARGGTSAMADFIGKHPQAFVTTPKEPHYYAFSEEKLSFEGPGDSEGINRTAVTHQSDFLGLFSSGEGKTALGDGSVSSFYYYEKSIPSMLATNPSMRALVILRDPVRRAYSSWQYMRVRQREPYPSFLEALDAEPQRIKENWHHLWHYRGMSTYASGIQAFQEAFGDQLKVVFHDDIVSRAESVSADILDFLGLDPSRVPIPEPESVNRSGKPRSPTILAAMNRARKVPALRDAVKAAIPFHTRERIRNLNLDSRHETKAERAELLPLVRNDLEHVQDLLRAPVPPGWFV